ncbi:MAG: hypothetical protein ABUL62_15145 [Myxococcales bacterium]
MTRVGAANAKVVLQVHRTVWLLFAPENHWITGQRIEASGGMML